MKFSTLQFTFYLTNHQKIGATKYSYQADTKNSRVEAEILNIHIYTILEYLVAIVLHSTSK